MTNIPNKTISPSVTILGIGNTLYSDEGVGIHILPLLRERLQTYHHVEIIEGATDGIRLLGPVEETEHLIIVDAMNGGEIPGTVYKVVNEEIPAYFGVKMSVHQVGFQEVLFAARIRERLPAHMIMFGVQPASLEFGIGLSATVTSVLVELVDRIEAQLREWTAQDE
ncbi:HyaD/HybD family hydrogenase maturation endopeptidase [Paenibacillus sp. UNC451MF]|uniref:HyaD/HybD family hydrogenase maturation endopeptidase n=1 Tax=Paenibacillus sp. UNC451MF TaxID=1449063 RepID=UPI00069220B4|nr:HyaD/HybD family hydrogenase maturation endopeptidase [Paenibacillus sp. UNC451MF]